MKIEFGKSYVARNGEVWTNPRRITKGSWYDWMLTDARGDKYYFTADGRFLTYDEECEHDLVRAR